MKSLKKTLLWMEVADGGGGDDKGHQVVGEGAFMHNGSAPGEAPSFVCRNLVSLGAGRWKTERGRSSEFECYPLIPR